MLPTHYKPIQGGENPLLQVLELEQNPSANERADGIEVISDSKAYECDVSIPESGL